MRPSSRSVLAVVLLTLAALLATAGPAFAVPPGNDSFASATAIGGTTGSIAGTNVEATGQGGEVAHFGADTTIESVWYAFTPPVAGVYSIETCAANFDAIMAVYSGTAIDGLTVLDADGAECGLGARTRVALASATTYRIAVDGVDDEDGQFVLDWDLMPPPPNDDISDARALTGDRGTVSGSTEGATSEALEPETGDRTLWYAWTAPATGDYLWSLCESAFDTHLRIYSGTPSTLTFEVENNDSSLCGDGFGSMATLTATAATPYLVQVDAGGAESAGPFTLRWARLDAATDSFAAPQVLTGASGFVASQNISSTGETGEPDHSGGSGAPAMSNWYSWTAHASGLAHFATCVHDFDTVMAVYTGAAVNALTLVGADFESPCDNSTVASSTVFTVTMGTVYRIVVDGDGSATGRYVLEWNYDSVGADSFAAPEVIAGTSGSVGRGNTVATVEAGEPDHALQSGLGASQSVWFSWTPAAGGSVVFQACAGHLDSTMAVYTGAAVNALTFIEATDVGCNNHGAQLEFQAIGGTNYRIAVSGTDGDIGRFVLRWDQYVAPVVAGSADLEAGVDDSADPVPAGTTVQYTARVRNLGPDPATSVTATIRLPQFGTLVSIAPGAGSCGAPVGRNIACSFGTIPPSGVVQTFVNVRMTHAGTQSLALLGLDSAETDPVANNNASSEQTTVTANSGLVPGVNCTIVGTNASETLNGTNGNDTICLLGGNDVSTGKDGNDTLVGGAGNDNLTGGKGSDTANGNAGDDTLNVKDSVNGNDSANGSGGTDTCTKDPGDIQSGCP